MTIQGTVSSVAALSGYDRILVIDDQDTLEQVEVPAGSFKVDDIVLIEVEELNGALYLAF